MKRSLWLIIIFFVFANLIFIILDRIPPHWDEAWYLSTSVRLYRSLVLGNLFIFLKTFSHAFGGDKAPLISALPLPFYLIFGTSYISAKLVNLCLVALLSLFTFKFVKYIEGSDEAGLFSVIIINTMPLFHSYAGQFMVEYGLSFLIFLSIYCLLKSNYFQNNKYVNLLGIIFGLGLLMKVLYPFYLIGPVFVILFSIIRYRRNIINRELLMNLFKIIFIGAMFASIWYVFNLKTVLRYGFHSGYGKFSGWYGLGNIFAISTLISYFNNFVQNGISLFYLVVFLSYALIFIIKRKSISMRFNNDIVVIVWFLVPFLVLVFMPNKLLRFLLPALSPFAIMLGIWTARIFKKKGLIILLFPMIVFFINPFVKSPLFEPLFNPPSIDTKSDWKLNEVVGSIPHRGKVMHLVLCAVDHQYYNNFTIDYYSLLKFLPYRFINSNFCRDWREVRFIMDKADFILIKSGYLGPDFCNPFSPDIRNFILNNENLFKQIKSFSLPDDSLISIYEKVR